MQGRTRSSAVRATITIAISGLVAVGLGGCGGVNSVLAETHQVVEYYRIFEVPAGSSRNAVIAAARTGLTRNVPNVEDLRPIPPAQPPAEPGRFKPVALFDSSSPLANFAGASVQGLKSADCSGAVWTANARRKIGNDSARLFVCLWEYNGGYHLDVYSTYSKTEGGISVNALAKAVTTPVFGTFEQALETTVNDMAREVQTAVGKPVRYIEGYPDPIGEPWWATGMGAAQP